MLSVFLHAPEAWRISRVQDVYKFADRRAAQQMVNDSDRARARFIQTLGALAWTDARGYDLALDTSTVTIEGVVEPDRGSGAGGRGMSGIHPRIPIDQV